MIHDNNDFSPADWKSSIGLEKYAAKAAFSSSSMSSSSSLDSTHTAENCRLYGSHSWCGANVNSYVQFDLGAVKQLHGIAMQGDGASARWVTEYKLEYGFALDEVFETKVWSRTFITFCICTFQQAQW